MNNKKNYVLDTNVLIENPESIAILQNGNENNIHIPYHVLIELNKLKNNPNLAHIVSQVVDVLLKNKDRVNVLRDEQHISPFAEIVDNYILREIKACPSITDPILVTNDKILQLQAGLLGIRSEEFRESRPFESESQLYTGFVDNDEQCIPNCFFWRDGKPVFNGIEGEKTINYTLNVWNLRPRSIYQNLALELMQNQAIDLVTIQSEAGYGKTL
jgi:PhoH-like ATPase